MFAPTLASSSLFWVRAITPTHWRFTLGVCELGGSIAADWSIDLFIEDGHATVSTSEYLTRDDVLVNGELHDALRAELLRTLALGSTEADTTEGEVAARSLTYPVRFPAGPVEAQNVQFAFLTSLEEDHVWERMTWLGLRQDPSLPRRWGIGLPRQDDHDYAIANYTSGRLNFDCFVGSTRPIERRIAQGGLRALAYRARLVLLSEDEAVRYDGPLAWNPE